MQAKLRGANFYINSDGYPSKPIPSFTPVTWNWFITPRAEGVQSLLLTISIPVKIPDENQSVSAQPLKDIKIEVDVEISKTPSPTNSRTPTVPFTTTLTSTPTLTPSPLINKVIDHENFGVIVAAVITGLVSTIIAAKSLRHKDKIEILNKQISETSVQTKELEKELERLKSKRWWKFW